ncbi:MAG: HK97 family phage prohead protease [Clostridium sp.]|nr:HK97 family phage prohead protease [Clostridium sp.]MCM1400248.1 HK97 family phage prohead protease [Clostridium sp.]MCM1460961.1 HK97 family phage prohead protease [Bacteroides sp.]
MNRTRRQTRTVTSEFNIREDGEALLIEGYFAVFNSTYNIAEGLSESIEPGAFTDTLSGDIRALINHDTSFVLGRTKVNTLTLKQDARGLWGQIAINPDDSDAMNLYARVKRGDVDQCSFGFDILEENAEFSDDGSSVHWKIKKVRLYEVSVCTFPAYEETSVQARQQDAALEKAKRMEVWKQNMRKKLRNEEENAC